MPTIPSAFVVLTVGTLRFAHPTALPTIAKHAAPKNEFHQPIQRDLGRPDCAAKIFRFSFPPNQFHLRAIPPHRRGAYASSRYVECGLRWTRGARAREALQGGLKLCLGAVSDRSAQDERRSSRTAKACGSGTRGWCQAGGGCSNPTGFDQPSIRAATEAKGIRLRGERAISRQTIAQGRPDALRWTCMLVCALLCAHCTRDRGCSAHPVFPAPSHS